MLQFIKLFILFIIASCSSINQGRLESFNHKFKYKDKTGNYLFQKNGIVKNKKFVSKTTLNSNLKKSQELEKTIAVSEMGTIGKNKRLSLRPKISQFTIWFDKKKYFSQLSVNAKNKSLDIVLKSPEAKWSGSTSVEFPAGDIFCFFSQIPECLRFHRLLTDGPEEYEFYIILDNYPYHTEVYENMPPGPFALAVLEFSGVEAGIRRYSLSLGNQIIFYLFNNNDEFERMYWVAQGISINK